jgi:O-antigen/teichoic acid export membrane protein
MSRKRLATNAVSGIVAFVVSVVLAFVMTPVIVRGLGYEWYGIWELAIGLVGYFGVLELGVGPALVAYVANAVARDDDDELNRILNTGLFTLAALGALGALVFAGISLFADKVIPVQSSADVALPHLMIVFGLILAASLVRLALSGFLLGLQAHSLVNATQMVLSILQAVVIYQILATQASYPLLKMACVVLAGSLVQTAIMAVTIRMLRRASRFSVRHFHKATVKELLHYGFKSTIIRASDGLLKRLVGFSIAHTAGVGKIVYFAMPNRLIEYAQSFVAEAALPLTPYYANIAGTGDRKATVDAWLETTRVCQVAVFGLAAGTLALGTPFIAVWIGAEVAASSRWVFLILALCLFSPAIGCNGGRLLMSVAKHGPLATFASIHALICFLLSLLLGTFWGVEGVAASMTIYSLGCAVRELTLACREYGVAPGTLVRKAMMPFLMPLAIGMGSSLLLNVWLAPDNYMAIFAHAVAVGTTYLLAVWLLALTSAERRFFVDKCAKLIASLRGRLAG